MSSEISYAVVRSTLAAGVLTASVLLGFTPAHADTAAGTQVCPAGQTLTDGVCQSSDDLGWQ
jgi:hypothetical protein